MRTRRFAFSIVGCVLLLAVTSSFAEEAPEPQLAPRPEYVERELPPGTGFIPQPVDQSHITGQQMPEQFKDYPTPPAQFDWRTSSKITSVKDQDTCGACYAFAALANFEAKILIDGGSTYDFSENHAKECNYYDRSCRGGNYWHLANLFSKTGTVLETCDPYVAWNTTCNTTCPYQKTLLDWRRICGASVPSTTVLKNYIYTYGPVFTVLYVGDILDASWRSEFGSYDGSYTLSYSGNYDPNHAVCIIGWDDSARSKDGKAGAWIVKNSWGTSWGGTCGYGSEGGYFKIAYGDARIGEWSSFLYDWQNYDTSGGILYYDEGGWRQSWGYGNVTGWGMCKFVPTSACQATRVEFWTTDITTDVDVYLYDTFSGGTLSTLLASHTDTSFGEVGYHSVPFSTPPSISAGNDVYAAVKFTNSTSGSPVAACDTGTVETNKTYMSHNGIAWTEMGAGLGTDVTIRLRYTTSTGAPSIDVIPDTLKYGQVTVSTDSIQALKIKNTGTDTLRVTDINPSSTVLAVSDTAFKVAPSDSHSVSVTFTPTAVQSYSENLTIVHNAKGTTVVPVLGQGVSAGAPGISVSPDTLKFGQVRVGADSAQTLRVKSTGTDTLHVTDMNLSSSVLAVSDTSFSLAPTESTDVTVTFTPAAIQSYSEMLTVVHNAKGTTIIPVVGSGVAGLDLVIATGDIQFDPAVPVVGDTVTVEARVHNVSTKGMLIAADSVVVRFYDGDPNVSGVQIGTDQIVPTIEPDSSETAQVMWDTQGQQGSHQIYVLVDPDDDILESNEGNNQAQKGITVNTMPVIQSVVLSDPSPTAAGDLDLEFNFDRAMDTAISPTATYGLTSPYDQNSIAANPGWSADSTTWFGRTTILAAKGDGLNTLRIQGAQDPDGQVMEIDTTWTFFVDTVVPSSQASSPAYTGLTNFSVNWSGSDPSPSSGIASYSVWVLVDGMFPTQWFTDTSDTTAVYSGSSGHFYSFYSTVKDSAGNEEAAPGAPDCTTYVDTDPPAIPTLLSPPCSCFVGDNTPTVTWSQVTKEAAVTYHLQVALNAGCINPVVDSSGLTDTSYTIATPLADQPYFWRVQATDMAQNSSGFQTTPFMMTVDTQLPLISSTTVWPDTGFSGPFPVSSHIGDPAGIALALLWYRTDLDTLWRADTMTVAVSTYQGSIPQQATPNTLVEYYVYAEDGAIPANSSTDPIGAPSTVYFFLAGETGIEDQEPFGGIPKRFSLYQNYPDPFNAGTEILYALPRDCHVRLEIYNVLGQRVRVLVEGHQTTGYHRVRWDGWDENGRPAASGIYLYRLRAEEYTNTRKMVLLK